MNPIMLYTWGLPKFPFEFTIKTDNLSAGSSANNQFKLPLSTIGTYNFKVEWGDGTSNQITIWNQATATHTYASIGTYVIKIKGVIEGFAFSNGGDILKLLNIISWGIVKFKNITNNFYGCTNLTLTTVKGTPRLSDTSSLWRFFRVCSNITTINNLTSWNTSTILTMQEMFYGCSSFNQNINGFNTSTTVGVPSMFQLATIFNNGLASGISGVMNLDTANVTDMTSMFNGCTAFNQNISSWNTTSCTILNSMFNACTNYNQPMNPSGSSWNTSNVTIMNNVFSSTNNFNNGLGLGLGGIMQWDTSKVTTMAAMFADAIAFNQDISGWDVSKVTNFGVMFDGATKFNQNLNNWNTIAATSFLQLFNGATIFNNGQASGIGGSITWNTSNVTNISTTFANCSNFNQNISSWDVTKVTTFQSMFVNCSKYNQPLNFASGTPALNTMFNTFSGCTIFNQNLDTWNVSKVTNMGSAFNACPVFNNGLGSGVSGTMGWTPPTVLLTSLDSTFLNCGSFNQNVNNWDVSGVTGMPSTFQNCSKFNQSLNLWNPIKVTDMGSMFAGCTIFNQDISTWDTRANTWLFGTFSGATAFNSALNPSVNIWNTGLVTSMASTFLGATNFNNGQLPGVGGTMAWNTTNVNTMSQMFSGASSFNQYIGNWDVLKVTTFGSTFVGAALFNNGEAPGASTAPMLWNTNAAVTLSSMFNGASSFNQTVANIKTSATANFTSMFQGATVFNQPLTTSGNFWNMSGATNMTSMFQSATAFNQDLSSWNVSNVTLMASMFSGASSFNQDISGWNMIGTTSVSGMFTNATAFNQNLGAWNMSTVTTFTNFMSGKTPATFSAANLDAIYNGWPAKSVQVTKTISFGTAKYSVTGASGRLLLTRVLNFTTIAAISVGTGGVFRVTTGSAQLSITGDRVYILGGSTYPTATGAWIVTRISSTQYDLQGTVFAGTFSGGGVFRTGFGWTITDGGSTLLDSMTAHYSLNSVLTNSVPATAPTATMNGITYVAGKTGNAAVFNAATDRIDIADTPFLQFTDGVANDVPFSINLWVYHTAFNVSGNFYINKRNFTATGDEWHFAYSGPTNSLRFAKLDKTDGVNNAQVIASPLNPFVINTWYNITITDDGSKTFAGMKLYINGVQVVGTDVSYGIYTGMPINGTSIVRMGQLAWSSADPNYNHLGYLEDVSVWKGKVLTQDEITYLYNNGVGIAYPFT